MEKMYTDQALSNLIATKLKNILELKNMSSLDLSNATGVNSSKISRVLTKKGSFSITELLNISKYLQVDMDYFLDMNNHLQIKHMPVIKMGSSIEIYLIEKDSCTKDNSFGIYIQKEMSSMLLPAKTLIIISIEDSNKECNKPVIFINEEIYCLGIYQNNKIVNIETGKTYNTHEIIILGEIIKQVIEVPKLVKQQSYIINKYLSKIDIKTVKYTYLYRLFSEL